jgi:hypothetical protein
MGSNCMLKCLDDDSSKISDSIQSCVTNCNQTSPGSDCATTCENQICPNQNDFNTVLNPTPCDDYLSCKAECSSNAAGPSH